jgi:arginyl-tRNA synthetase
LPVYLYELSSEFHSYWNLGKDNELKRFIDKNNKVSDDKLVLLKAVSNVIKIGLDIIGVDSPKKM